MWPNEAAVVPFPDWYIMPVYKLMDLAGYGLSTGGVPLGHVILTSHLYMAYAMIILVYVHMFRNYFKGD